MKIVVIGGSGLIGSKLVGRLREGAHEVVAASPASGVNTVTGDGLPEALEGAEVVVDVANSPSLDGAAAWDFFFTSGSNLMAAERAAGVRHHVTLSVVGSDRLQNSGYFRAKLVQEQLVRESGRPYTIVRSTQFFEFMDRIAGASMLAQVVRLSPAFVRPIAADDVAESLASVAFEAPANAIVEIAGPQSFHLNELVGRVLAARLDERLVIADPDARYFGVALEDLTLVPGKAARIAPTTFDDWLSRTMPAAVAGPRELARASS